MISIGLFLFIRSVAQEVKSVNALLRNFHDDLHILGYNGGVSIGIADYKGSRVITHRQIGAVTCHLHRLTPSGREHPTCDIYRKPGG